MRSDSNVSPAPPKPVRCAVYTRKSTEDGLEQDFNSLDAQREAGEAYIKSQAHMGWVCLEERYDDGGYTGGNMDRPALMRLLQDIDSGKVDCVVVYKVDRFSRSLLDFAKMMGTFEKNQISFVSVTQHFNTAISLGRLVLNILLSFAQFEREMISERTRDKIAATRRKGKWSGGPPILGYDIKNMRLVVDEAEAYRVREIFDLYLRLGTLLAAVKELNGRGWRSKSWTTKKGRQMGGFVFTKTRLYELLTNVLYIGKVRYKKEIHQGEHQGIVDEEVFQLVQECLKRNGRSGGTALLRNKYGALLRGLLKCASCSAAMTQAARRKGGIVYRYYVCSAAQRLGRDTCPNPSVPAGELEQFVIDEIRGIGGDTNVLKEVIRLYRIETDEKIARLCKENDELRRDIARMARDADDLAVLAAANGGELASSLALNERLVTARRRQTDINDQLAALNKLKLDDSDARLMLADFDTIWANLTNREQCRLIELLVERVVYDGKKGVISITFRPSGITTLDANATELKGNAA